MIHDDILEKKSGIIREPIPAGLGNLDAHGMLAQDPVCVATKFISTINE
jgi:hypothetical protein